MPIFNLPNPVVIFLGYHGDIHNQWVALVTRDLLGGVQVLRFPVGDIELGIAAIVDL